MRTGLDYSGRVVVQELTLQSRNCFNRALVPAQSAPCMCHPWRWLGDAPTHFKAGCWGHQPKNHLRENQMQVKFSHSQCPTQGDPPGTSKKSVDGHHPCHAWKCLERPSLKPRPVITSAGLRDAQAEVQDTFKPDSACLGSTNF